MLVYGEASIKKTPPPGAFAEIPLYQMRNQNGRLYLNLLLYLWLLINAFPGSAARQILRFDKNKCVTLCQIMISGPKI